MVKIGRQNNLPFYNYLHGKHNHSQLWEANNFQDVHKYQIDVLDKVAELWEFHGMREMVSKAI